MDANKKPMTPEQFNELLEFTSTSLLGGISVKENSEAWQHICQKHSVIEACELLCEYSSFLKAERMNWSPEQWRADGEERAKNVLFRLAASKLKTDLEYCRSLNEYIQDDHLGLAIHHIHVSKVRSDSAKKNVEARRLEAHDRNEKVRKEADRHLRSGKSESDLATTMAPSFGVTPTTMRTWLDVAGVKPKKRK